MASIRIDRFNGLVPRTEPSLLSEGCATTAHNLLLKNGKIVPLLNPSYSQFQVLLENGLDSLSNAKTIYPWRRKQQGNEVITFLAWSGDVDVAQSNIANDDRDRLFVSGDTGIPYVSGTVRNEPSVYFNNRNASTVSSAVCRRTLVKSKMPAVVATNAGGGSETGTKRYTVFFQTWVDKYGFESPVSDASNTVEYYDGDTINIAAVSSPGTQAVTRRIYKTITGDNTADNRFVTEFSDVDRWGSKDIAIPDANVAEVMPMVEAPPSDLRGIVYVPGGYYAGFSSSKPRTVFFSDALMPYSWPTAYQYDLHDDIVALCATKNTVFALTTNRVWVLRGTSPDTMVVSSLSQAACVSKKSVVEYGNRVFFATNYGYCMVHNNAESGEVVTNLTDKFFTRDQWRDLNPQTCRAVQIDGRIMAFFSVGAATSGFVFDLNESDCMLTTHGVSASCCCVDVKEDTMHFVAEA